MRFKRIDVDTVRCIISEEELIENGLEVDDFLQNDGRTESFLRKIISMAEEEVGYKVQGGNITIQVAVLPEHTLALTFSEKPELGISNMLENLKSAVESLVKNAPDIDNLKQAAKELTNQNDADADIADSNEQKYAAAGNAEEKNPATNDANQNSNEGNAAESKSGQPDSKAEDSADKKQSTGGFALKDRNFYQLRFADMERVIRYAKGVCMELPMKSSLYYLTREEAYYLLFEKGELSDKQLCRLLSASLEFADDIYAHGPTRAYIMEHGKCILPEMALEHLQEI